MLLDSFDLPISWSRIQVDNAVKSISTNGKKIPQKEYLSHGLLPVIDQGQDLIGGYTNDFSLKVECSLPIIIFGDHTRVVKYINQEFAAGADGVKVLESTGFFNVKLLNYFIQYITSKLPSHGYARHYQHLSKEDLPLPPINEQHRIVAKIEELFSELDQGIDNLKTAQAQLKVYRQALLKHAFEGKLTAEWRAQNADKLESANALQQRIQHARELRYQQQLAEWQANGKQGSKPKAPKPIAPLTAEELAGLPELPEGWVYVYLAEVGDLGRGKSKHRPRNDPKLFGGSYPFIQTGVVKAAKKIITEYNQTYSEFGLAQSKLWPKGTLCITIAANIAETAFLGFDGCFPDSVVGFTANEKIVSPDYVDYFIQAVRSRVEAYAPATAQKNINLETLENLVVPYCALKEQFSLQACLDEKFSEIDQLDQTITTSLQQAEALRQSILKKAFSGELVPHNIEDEPASELLERIKNQKSQKSLKSEYSDEYR